MQREKLDGGRCACPTRREGLRRTRDRDRPPFEYAPAPESPRPGSATATICSSTERGSPRSTEAPLRDDRPGQRTAARGRGPCGTRRCRRGVRRRAPRLREVLAQSQTRRDRGQVYLSHRARGLRTIARTAVLKTLDGGKPIKESRDFDLPASRRTSSITRVGRTNSHTRCRAGGRARPAAAYSDRSFRGIFRCSWPLGRSRRRWPRQYDRA